MKKLFAIFFLFAIAFSNAAVIKGIVFDSNLEPVKAIVSVNTTPMQTMVAQNGSFSFQVPKGFFVLSVKAGNYTTSEGIAVESEGVFNIDLILFGFEDPTLETPGISEGTGFEGQVTSVGGEEEQPQAQIPWGFAAIVLIAIVGLALVLFKWKEMGREAKKVSAKKPKRKTSEWGEKGAKEPGGLNEFQKKIVEEMRKSEGRITQRELRQLLPWSEAKVSIELDLLEEKGVIKKFKKGRGNVVILAEK